MLKENLPGNSFFTGVGPFVAAVMRLSKNINFETHLEALLEFHFIRNRAENEKFILTSMIFNYMRRILGAGFHLHYEALSEFCMRTR